MALESVVILGVVVLIFVGLVGTVIPAVPGVPFVFAGIALYAWNTSFKVISPGLLAIFLAFTVGAMVLDYVASALGARRFGASRAGVWGAVIGALLGVVFLGPFGVLIGPFAGAALGELITGRSLEEAGRSGWGSLLGTLASVVGQLVIALCMVIAFLIILF